MPTSYLCARFDSCAFYISPCRAGCSCGLMSGTNLLSRVLCGSPDLLLSRSLPQTKYRQPPNSQHHQFQTRHVLRLRYSSLHLTCDITNRPNSLLSNQNLDNPSAHLKTSRPAKRIDLTGLRMDCRHHIQQPETPSSLRSVEPRKSPGITTWMLGKHAMRKTWQGELLCT